MSSRQLAVINGPVIQSTSTMSASAVAERDSNGDTEFNHPIAKKSLKSEGGLITGYASKTADYTADEIGFLYEVDCTSAARTLTLPPAASYAGLLIAVKKADTTANVLTVDGNASETIDGDTAIYLTTKNEVVFLQSDGTNFKVVNRYIPRVSVAKSAAFTAGGDGTVYLITAGGGGFTITLPPAANWKGKSLWFKKVDSGVGTLTLDGDASETIDGSTTATPIGTQYYTAELYSDGSNWHILSNKN